MSHSLKVRRMPEILKSKFNSQFGRQCPVRPGSAWSREYCIRCNERCSRRGPHRRRSPGLEQVFRIARPSAGHDGDIDRLGHGFGHRQVVAILGAIRIHRCQDDFAGAETLDLSRPFDGFKTGRRAAAVDVDFPEFLAIAVDSPGIDIHNCRTAAELAGHFGNQRSGS